MIMYLFSIITKQISQIKIVAQVQAGRREWSSDDSNPLVYITMCIPPSEVSSYRMVLKHGGIFL